MQVADLEAGLTPGEAQPGAASWMLRHRRLLVGLAVLAMALLGFAALHGLLAEVRLRDVRAALHDIPSGRIVLALALTAGSYLCLTCYDLLALRAIGRPLPWRTAALASFTSYAISNNLGLSLLTGGSARYRVYAAAGLELPDVARVTLLASATFWGGVIAVAAAGLSLAGAPIDLGVLTIAPVAGHVAAAILLACIALPFVLRMSGREQIGHGRFTLPIPAARIMAAQIGVATLDLTFAAAALYVLMPAAAAPSPDLFLIAYAVGLLAVLVTHVPGGIGVFEAVMLAIVPGDRPGLFAALLLYRIVYYVLPWSALPGCSARSRAGACAARSRSGCRWSIRPAARLPRRCSPCWSSPVAWSCSCRARCRRCRTVFTGWPISCPCPSSRRRISRRALPAPR